MKEEKFIKIDMGEFGGAVISVDSDSELVKDLLFLVSTINWMSGKEESDHTDEEVKIELKERIKRFKDMKKE